jgi:hypothetical protein
MSIGVSMKYDGTIAGEGQTAGSPLPQAAVRPKIDGWRRDMDKIPLTDEEIARLKKREAEVLARIERLRSTMNETKALDTIAFKAKLLKEAQAELHHVQDKLAGLDDE